MMAGFQVSEAQRIRARRKAFISDALFYASMAALVLSGFVIGALL